MDKLSKFVRDGKGGYEPLDPNQLEAIHMRRDEAVALDTIQGGPDIRDGLRCYEKLGEMFKADPSLEQKFRQIHQGLEEGDPQLNQYADEAQKKLPELFNSAPADKDPVVQDYAADGTGGDTEIVLMPLHLLYFFSEINGGLVENPDGLFQLGGSSSNPIKAIGKGVESVVRGGRDVFKNPGNFARTAGAFVIGSALGGPVGALGAMAGHLHGQGNGQKGMWGALKGAGIASLANMGLNAVGMGMPSLAGVPGFGTLHAGASHLGQMGSNLGSYAGLQNGGSGGLFESMRGSVGNLMSSGLPGAAGASGATGTAGAAGAAAGTGGFNLGGLGLPLALVAGSTALGYMGSKQQHKKEMELYERMKADQEAENRRLGVYDKFVKPEPWTYKPTGYATPTSDELEGGYSSGPGLRFYNRAAGGRVKDGEARSKAKIMASHLIRGKTKGQDDVIKRDAPSGSYIIDASTVSGLGDGSTEAGGRELDKLFARARNKVKGISRAPRASKVPLIVAAGEYEVSERDVTKLGGGNNELGAQKLDALVKRVRAHKISNGTGLPPRALSPLAYLQKAKRG